MTIKHKHLLRELSRADYITVAAVFSILNSFWLLWNGHTKLAIALAFVSTFLDYLDGSVARRYGSSKYGKVLDSLYDVLGWVMFPALAINIQAKWAWWSIIVTTIFCVVAILRLSRFTVSGYIDTDKKYYDGLPVLFSKYPLLLCFVAGAKISVILLVIMIPLMVSSRRFLKPHPITSQIELLYALFFLLFNFYHG